MSDKDHKEGMTPVEADEEERRSPADLHPNKSHVAWTNENTVSFPDIVRFSTAILLNFGAAILDETVRRLYEGQLASVCGLDKSSDPRLTRKQCWIDPRMAFWRENKHEFTADLTIHLDGYFWEDETGEDQCITLYASLDFSIDDEISYDFTSLSLNRPQRCQIKLDDYLIPVLNLADVNKAAEDLLFLCLPEALRDSRALSPYRLAEKMGLKIVRYKLYRNHKTRSVLYWADSEVMVTAIGGDDKTPPDKVNVPAGTIVINENLVSADRERLSIFHECFHDEYHWMFFRLQEMHNNDLRKIPKTRKAKNKGKAPKNPLTILEWEARQGAQALMLPTCILIPIYEQYRHKAWQNSDHAGRVYENIIRSISGVLNVPKFVVRARLLQLGHWQAQGALNYIRTSPDSGRYIDEFMFAQESCPDTSHTFVISPKESFKLYERNAEYRAHIDTGNYVYVEGHICLNDAAYVIQTQSGPRMTDWANRHIDECCLRFENVYEINEGYEFRLNSINCDKDYNRHYFDFLGQVEELSFTEKTLRQQEILASLPATPGEAIRALMKMCGNVTQEKMAELTRMSRGAIRKWLNATCEFKVENAVRVIVGLHLPPWLSERFLEICGISLQSYGLHLAYKNIINLHFMDTLDEVISKIEDLGHENKFKDKE